MITAHEKRLGEDLVKVGRLSDQNLAEAIAHRQKNDEVSFRKVLTQRGFIDERDLMAYFADRYKMPSVDLSSEDLDPEAVALVPYSLCAEFNMAPVRLAGDELTAAISDPLRYVPVEQALQAETGKKIKLALASEEGIRNALDEHYAEENTGDRIELKFDKSTSPDAGDDDDDEAHASEEAAASVATVLNNILAQALTRRASDIHFEPAEHFLRVRLRVDGELEDALSLPPDMLQPLVTRVKVAARLDIGERRLPQDGNIAMKASGKDVDLRVSTLPTIYGERIVMRILDKSNVPEGLDALGLEPDVRDQFKACLAAPHGVILVTGPTGSGKTTTLYAALSHLRRPGANILTVENPVEYKLGGISQVQTHSKIGLDFARTLEAFLRQDPDVILLGEIRNEETAEVAMQASMTGHMVLSTLHMHSAAEALTRLIEMGVKQYVVGSTLRGVMAQRLVRRICDNCKIVDESHPELVERFELDPACVMRGAGCEKCGYNGNLGRAAINELLVVSEGIREGIMSNATAQEVQVLAQKEGMRTLAQAALLKVANGIAAMDQVLPYLNELSETPA